MIEKGPKTRSRIIYLDLRGLMWRKSSQKSLKEDSPNRDFLVSTVKFLWYADIANFIVRGVVPEYYYIHQRRKLISDAKHYFLG